MNGGSARAHDVRQSEDGAARHGTARESNGGIHFLGRKTANGRHRPYVAIVMNRNELGEWQTHGNDKRQGRPRIAVALHETRPRSLAQVLYYSSTRKEMRVGWV